jgi:hypothetical protein
MINKEIKLIRSENYRYRTQLNQYNYGYTEI